MRNRKEILRNRRKAGKVGKPLIDIGSIITLMAMGMLLKRMGLPKKKKATPKKKTSRIIKKKKK